MTQKTEGIILRAVKYGETSLILTVFTEMFGAGSYVINSVRTEKSGGGKAALFQPGEWLSLEVYHSEGRSVNRIKEASRMHLFQHNPVDVMKHSAVLFMMELLYKCLKHPEQNKELFVFCTNALITLDEADADSVKDEMLIFSLNLPQYLGYGIIPLTENPPEDNDLFLDLAEGSFSVSAPEHPYWISGTEARKAAHLLNGSGNEFSGTAVNYSGLLQKITDFYSLHNPEFGTMRTLPFLQEMIS